MHNDEDINELNNFCCMDELSMNSVRTNEFVNGLCEFETRERNA